MLGKVLVYRNENGEITKEPLSIKNVDIDFKIGDANFNGTRILRVNQEGITKYHMIIILETISHDASIVFTGLIYKEPVKYSPDFRLYHMQQIEFFPY